MFIFFLQKVIFLTHILNNKNFNLKSFDVSCFKFLIIYIIIMVINKAVYIHIKMLFI
jgi:hypothetical protein